MSQPPQAGAPAPFSIPEHQGLPYDAFLARLHQALRPRTYLEIGTAHGGTLQLAACASIAVDPRFALDRDVVGRKPCCLLFQQTSDVFFRSHDPRALLGLPLDLAFLDGMHHYEYLLRDFINTERHCHPASVILLHDCLPTDAHVARRDYQDATRAHLSHRPGWWAGDVWKTVAILRRHRPGLSIRAFDAPPTGLIAVTGLDPASRVLSDGYFDLVAEFAEPDPAGAALEAFLASLPILDSRACTDPGVLPGLLTA